MVRRKLRWCHRAERSAVRGERHRKTQAVRRKRQRTDTAGRCGHRPLRIGICRGGIQQNCELKASPGGSCHGAAVTDEGKRSLQMQPTADINQKGLPSGQKHGRLARLGRFAILPVSSYSSTSFIRHRRRMCPNHPTSLRSATCLACRLGRRFCLRQRCPPDTRGLACRLGRRFCLRQRCPPDTRAPREGLWPAS